MAEQIVKVPNIGDSKPVEIVEVLVKPGDTVTVDQSLIALESDKASMEVPSPLAGVVKSLQIKKGDKVSEGSPILTLDVGAALAATDAPITPTESITMDVPVEPKSAPTESIATAIPVTAAHGNVAPEARPSPCRRGAPTAASNLAHASPVIRRFARELGADVAQIQGSGPKGRILKEDVQTYVKARLQQPVSVESRPHPGPRLALSQGEFPSRGWEAAPTAFGPVKTQPLSRIQKLSATYLQQAWQTIPHVTHHDEADVTDLEAFRQSLKDHATKQGVKLTLLPFIVAAVVAALKEFPRFNASLDGDTLILKQYYHIGMAVDTEEGLVVPVLRDADTKRTLELATAIADLSERARNRRLKREEIEGGCFTLSSLGGVGGRFFTPIINAPEVAILGLCRSHWAPVYQSRATHHPSRPAGELRMGLCGGEDGQFVPRLLLPLSLSYDHRVIDGAAAARFMSHVKELLGDIRRLLL